MTMIKVARGLPTAEEIAAVLVVLHARAAQTPAADVSQDTVAVWADKTRIAGPWHGRAAWRTSYWPC